MIFYLILFGILIFFYVRLARSYVNNPMSAVKTITYLPLVAACTVILSILFQTLTNDTLGWGTALFFLTLIVMLGLVFLPAIFANIYLLLKGTLKNLFQDLSTTGKVMYCLGLLPLLFICFVTLTYLYNAIPNFFEYQNIELIID